MPPCPHCRAAALPEPDAAMRWRCGVCGGPVVPLPDDVPRSHAELASLVAAQRVGAIAKAWLAGALVLGASAAMAFATAVILWSVAHLAATVLTVVAAATGALAAVAGRRSRERRATARASLDEAWERAADDVLRARWAVRDGSELAHRSDHPAGAPDTEHARGRAP